MVAARDLFAALLATATSPRPEHPDTLNTRSNLASWTGEAGEVAAARDLAAALLADQRRVLGPGPPRHPEHPGPPRQLDRTARRGSRGAGPGRRAAG